MSISNSLSNAISGMNAASRMAEIVSSNVSNSLTEGYGRRSLNLSSQVVGGRGAGVEIGAVTRHVDRGVIADRRLAGASLGNAESLVSTLSQVEDIIGRVGDADSISSRIVDVEAALIDAASDPSSPIGLSSLSDRLGNLTQGLNTASQDIQRLRAEADRSISQQIDILNSSLAQVEQLNGDISSAMISGVDPSGLIDQRQVVIDKIAEIVPVREMDRDRGAVALMTPKGEMLIDGRAKEFGFTANAVIAADMTFASGALGGITFDGELISTDGISKLAGGTLGAAFQARDSELVTAQVELDTIAADLISRFQDPTVDPTLAVGDAGLLTDSGNSYDPVNLTGLSGRISVNASIDPAQGGTLNNLRDGINATTPGASGNAALFQALSEALAAPLTAGPGTTSLSAAGRASQFEAATGAQRLNFESELSFSNARWSSLKEAEAADGVDTDFEMQMLLRVEQAYAANARVIQTVDSLMQRLMEI